MIRYLFSSIFLLFTQCTPAQQPVPVRIFKDSILLPDKIIFTLYRASSPSFSRTDMPQVQVMGGGMLLYIPVAFLLVTANKKAGLFCQLINTWYVTS
ncbi:hypothetical protein D3C71_151990 [compost metagenome]